MNIPLNQTDHWFSDRNHPTYLDLLSSKLDLDYLIDTAIPVNEKSHQFEKIIRIDFSGIAGTTILMNKRNDIKTKEVNQKFLALFENLKLLEEKKIRLKTRFLFTYLYSDFAFALIEAERTPFRATMENPINENRNFKLFSLTKEDFVASSIYQNQKRALLKLEDIYNKFYRLTGRTDILNLRFSCLPLNFCNLTINNDTFIDPYSFAKQDEMSSLAFETPLIHISEQNNKMSFNTIQDHFRYMWIHPTTLFFEDATNSEFNINSGNHLEGLSDFKEPSEILFEKKTQKYKDNFKDNISEEELNRWKFKVERMFSSMTRKIEVSPDSETIFIGFSFKKGQKIANTVKEYIQEDFTSNININIVDVWNKGRNPLYQELMKNMNKATIGLIFFTKDIEEIVENEEISNKNYYSRPNLYFEYGYLMKQVERYGPPLRRVMIIAEDSSVIPTDMQDMPRENLSGNLHINYKSIIKRLLEVNQSLNQPKAEKAVTSYIQRLQIAFNDGFILEKELKGKTFNEFVSDVKNELLGKIHERFGRKR